MRKLCKSILALPILLMTFHLGFGQKMSTEELIDAKNLRSVVSLSAAHYQGDYYLEADFTRIPKKERLAKLSQQGIQLLQYRSGRRYLLKVPASVSVAQLKTLGVTHVELQRLDQKLKSWSSEEEYPSWVKEVPGKLDVAFVFHEGVSKSQIQQFIADNNIEIIEDQHRGYLTLIARINEDALENLAAAPIVAHLDMEQEPIQMLNREVCVNQKNNVLNSNLLGGYNLRGKGVTIGVGDGGQLGGHIDFGNRVINKANGTYSSFGDHGDHVSGIIGAGGNLNPRHQGMAAEASIITQKTSQITYRTEEYFEDYGMVLTNNSYGTSFNCNTNGSYNYSAQILDWQLREYPEVLHVFAAGNSGNGTCAPYPKGYHTVLRYYQSAKNVLTVGMVKENREAVNNSSRGPVRDGRLKPEIMGVGRNVTSTSNNFNYSTKGGTSMAAPAVTGTLGLLVEQYRLENGGANPHGDLVKAVACNTAEDLGNPGPDFIYGFGLINGRRAVDVIKNNQYQSDLVEDGESINQTIVVPAGTTKAKFMLYWHDKESPVYPAKTLINNLDVSIITPSGETILPWVLDPSSEGVAEQAVRGVDDLNNIEQITIDNPEAGVYTLVINGTEVPFGPQKFVTTYDLVHENLLLTFPFGGESFIPGNKELITWEAEPTNESTFKLEFSLDGGNTWLLIAPNLPAEQRNFSWTVPENFSAEAKIRVTKNDSGVFNENGDVFYVMDLPEELNLVSTCESQVLVSWAMSDYATEYEVFMYDGETMKSVGTTSEDHFVVDKDMVIGNTYWFAIRANSVGGARSQRTIAKSIELEYVELCPWNDNPVVLPIYQIARGRALTEDGLEEEDIIVKVKNIGSNDLTQFDLFYSVNGGAPIQETFNGFIAVGETQEVVFETPADLSAVGVHHVDVWVQIHGNNFEYQDSILNIVYAEQLRNDKVYLPFNETFAINSTTTFVESTLGLAECIRWDFDHHGTGELDIVQDEALVLRPIVPANGHPLQNNAILTLNLSEYAGTSEEINLSFAYQNDGASPTYYTESMANQVMVRGRDTDEWLNLYQLKNKVGNWLTVEGIDVQALLADNGQTFSASTQFKFANNNNFTIAIKDIRLAIADNGIYTAPDDNFTLTQIGDDVLLTWTPAETAEHLYEIEVLDITNSEEDDETTDFDVIGTVYAERTTTQPYFTFLDKNPGVVGTRYYRIKQVDEDGTITYSPVLSITINHEEISGVFPNPFGDAFHVSYRAEKEGIVNVQVISMDGKRVVESEFAAAKGMNYIPMLLHPENAPGIYYVIVTGEQAEAMYHKVVKQ